MDENIRINLLKRNEILNKKQDLFDNWLKGIITIATGLMAILISLKSGASKSEIQHNFFIFSIMLLSSGIFWGTLTLHKGVADLNKERKLIQKHINRQREGYNGSMLSFVNTCWIYKLASYLSILSFLLSLFTLVGYAICTDK